MRLMELHSGCGEKICVNPSNVAYVKSLDEEGCYLYFVGGESIPVKERYETVTSLIEPRQ